VPPGRPLPFVASLEPLLGNRVDRFRWNGSTLTFDRNIIRLHAFQNDHNNVANPNLPVLRGNHNGGVLRFGPDGKLYIIIGDNGRRGWLQNNLEGPVPDDDFGGTAPDNAHLTGVIILPAVAAIASAGDGCPRTGRPSRPLDQPPKAARIASSPGTFST